MIQNLKFVNYHFFISVLLVLTVAQNGYEYNKPRNPFPSSSSRPGLPSGPPGSYSTTTSYPGRQQNDEYAGSSTPGFPSGPSNYPTGPQGFPGSSSQRPQTSFPGQGSSYSDRGPTGPDDYKGLNGASYPGGPGQNSRYPSGPSFGPESGSPGSGPGSPSSGFGGPGFGPGGPGFGPGSPSFGLGGPGFGPGSNGYRPSTFGPGGEDTGEYEGGDYSAIPGQPDIDYPILSYIPSTSFSCESQAYPGYYADVETRCQVFHVCANNKTYDFLCPNGTIFSQEVFVCVWWDQFDCNSAPSLYGLNANLYDYSITGSQNGFNGLGPNNYNQGPRGPTYSAGTPQGPSSGFPGNSGPYGPQSNFPGSSGPSGFPGNNGPNGLSNGYTGSGPSYPGTGPQGPSTSYPGTGLGFPVGPNNLGSYPTSTPYPGSSGSQGLSTSGSYPGTGPGSSYSGSAPSNFPGSNSGYPSGKPSGPSFPGGNGRPQQPNREYLPPN